MQLFNKIVNWYFKRDSLPYWCIIVVDCLICYMAGLFVFWLYYGGTQTLANFLPITRTLLVYMVFNVIGFKLFHTFAGIIRYSSFVDLTKVGQAMLFACVCVILVHFCMVKWDKYELFLPLSVKKIIMIYLISMVAMWTLRVMVKTVYDIIYMNDGADRTFIYGVKEGGIGIAKNLRNLKPAKFLIKGFISHDNSFTNRYLLGERVYAVNEQLPSILKNQRVKAVVVSPLRNEDFRNDHILQQYLIEAGVHIFMMPSMDEWTHESEIKMNSLKEVSIEDLLPRNEINIDVEAMGKLLKGKNILVTGSAGSIGSEMVRQICVHDPGELMLIDQAETPQHDVRLMMAKNWPNIKCHTVVASITNHGRMEKIFKEFRPDFVFHAAAYKHVPMMEDNPSESIQNNVYGTKVIADLSVKYGVKKFVMISTDKAVNPTNVMGCSKRICEIYVQSLDKAIKDSSLKSIDGMELQNQPCTQFVTTRFGNVLGSNGSVIPLFEKQIKSGGPITVTDPNIVRYFMLIPEACKLVLEAGTHGHGGEIFVFDMGKPVKIADLAKRMIMLSGAKNIQIKYTGLRPGEKLYEEVLSNNENSLPSFHKKIRIAKVREYAYQDVEKQIEDLVKLSESYDDMAIVAKMKEIVPEYKSKNSIYHVLDKEAPAEEKK